MKRFLLLWISFAVALAAPLLYAAEAEELSGRGINNYTPSLLKGRSDVTGIVEAIDLAGTIEVMLRLHPAAREIFVPHDYTVTGLAARKAIEALVPRFGAKVRFRFTDPLTMEELERLPKNSLVLEMGFITDKFGRTFDISETTRNHRHRKGIHHGELCITPEIRQIVIPAKAGIQSFQDLPDSRFRRNDKVGVFFKALTVDDQVKGLAVQANEDRKNMPHRLLGEVFFHMGQS